MMNEYEIKQEILSYQRQESLLLDMLKPQKAVNMKSAKREEMFLELTEIRACRRTLEAVIQSNTETRRP